MNLTPSKSQFHYSQKLIDFGKYFLISLVLLLGLHLVAYANSPEVIIQPEWSVDLEANISPITAGEQLFVIGNQKSAVDSENYSATLFAINTVSGKVQWQQKLPSREIPGSYQLIFDNGTIYASHDNGVVGFDPKTGSPKTSFKYTNINSSGSRDRLMGIHQDIAVYGDSIPINKSDLSRTEYETKVFGITKDKTIWSYQLPKNGLIGGISEIEPVIQNGILLLPSRHNTTAGWTEQFTMMDVASGKVLRTWEAPQNPNGLGLRSAKVFGDTLFYTSTFDHSKMHSTGSLRAISLQTGKEKWAYAITDETNWRTKAVSDREVLVWQSKDNVDGNFVVLDKETGRFSRSFKVNLGYSLEPQILTWADGRIYIEALETGNEAVDFFGPIRNSWVRAFDDKTGKSVWRTSTLLNSSINYPPIVSAVADKPEQKRLIFASNILRTEGSSKVHSFLIP
ncbi:PQQ-binding-like beta-propeller repeat protein [Pseudanabaena sp. ABRG5-3]|uniref:outer membrane protein assembly factor BamB family protein n=1 Tax=Pseudanabaena sp. ABRG5-3 TaxID=685565 RepID=UPI000DC70940|nr:PQQ-binding-like beta-propeller repeat protein [Pseudanabaena sp. ABRG5-3]BBC22670.1 pyrrolo-quinoline quinone [Pseudanabaena sp. ABRG5-3]